MLPDKELQEKIDVEQARLKNYYAQKLKPTKAESYIKWHANDAKLAEGEINRLVSQRKPEESPDLEAAIDFQRTRLTKALVVLGRFDEAEYATPDDQKDYVRRMREAVDRDDKDLCECEPYIVATPGTQPDVEIHPFHVKHWIYSPKHQKPMAVVGCAGCEFLNVTPHLPPVINEAATMNPSDHAAQKAKYAKYLR